MLDIHKQKLEKALRRIKQKIPGLLAVVLFGTFGTEHETTSSDLDLAILSNNKLDQICVWNLAQDIAIELNQDVDLIDLHLASTVFRFQILSSGTVIYCSDEKIFGEFDTTAFSMYFDFQEIRKGILEDYKKAI